MQSLSTFFHRTSSLFDACFGAPQAVPPVVASVGDQSYERVAPESPTHVPPIDRHSTLSPAAQALHDQFRDPITQSLIIDPVLTNDGHVLERATAQSRRYVEYRRDEPLPAAYYVPFVTLRQLVDSYQAAGDAHASWAPQAELMQDAVQLVPLSAPAVLLDGHAYDAASILDWRNSLQRTEGRPPLTSPLHGYAVPLRALKSPQFNEFCASVGIANPNTDIEAVATLAALDFVLHHQPTTVAPATAADPAAPDRPVMSRAQQICVGGTVVYGIAGTLACVFGGPIGQGVAVTVGAVAGLGASLYFAPMPTGWQQEIIYAHGGLGAPMINHRMFH